MSRSSRRRFLQRSLTLGTVGLLWGCGGLPQSPPTRVYRIGFLSLTPGPPERSPFLASLKEGLREHGLVEGLNLVLESRFAYGKEEHLPELAAELVGLKVDAIVGMCSPETEAARQVAGSLPIVMAAAADPVGLRLIDSLARPGGNITGFSTQSGHLAGKRLELLKQAIPNVSRVAVLWNATKPEVALELRAAEEAGSRLGLQVQSLPVRDPGDLVGALQAATGGAADAAMPLSDNLVSGHQAVIIEVLNSRRLPAIYGLRPYVVAGGLIAYGADWPELHRRAASYIQRIVQGARPADLPVEQPTKFDLVINLKTAQALGLTIPQPILAQATELIQ